MTTLHTSVEAHDYAQGAENAPLTVVHYGDFQCPFSGQAYHVIKELQNSLGDNLRYVFRYFPLDDIHPNAMEAALAAEAAASQGKFWPMYAALFENQEALSHAHLLQYAKHIGLDEEEFARALKSDDIRKRVSS